MVAVRLPDPPRYDLTVVSTSPKATATPTPVLPLPVLEALATELTLSVAIAVRVRSPPETTDPEVSMYASVRGR